MSTSDAYVSAFRLVHVTMVVGYTLGCADYPPPRMHAKKRSVGSLHIVVSPLQDRPQGPVQELEAGQYMGGYRENRGKVLFCLSMYFVSPFGVVRGCVSFSPLYAYTNMLHNKWEMHLMGFHSAWNGI